MSDQDINPAHQSLNIKIFEDAEEACAGGYDYRTHEPQPTPVEVKEVIVVRNGTKGGNPTVDFLMEDATGKRYVFMVTRRLLVNIPG